ncbi:MAG TPA: TRAP transporter large permease [Chloroflexota bacterium]
MSFVGVLVLMLVGFGIGVPVAYALLAPSVIYMITQNVPILVIPQKLSNGVESFPLLAVPFFIAAGELMNTGGVTRRLVNLASTAVGHLTGGLAHVVVVANMIMAGMSGSALADAAGTGRVLIPAMVQEGYSKPFAAAIVSAAGTIGPIIPPSIAFVLYGFIASTSVGRLFLGGIIPGILMGLFLMVTAHVISSRRNYPKHERATCGQFTVALKEGSWALLMPLLIIGGILSGVFTPTEAAGVAACYGLFVGVFIYREIGLKDLFPVATRVVRSTSVVLFIVAAANVVQYIVTREGVDQQLLQAFSPLAGNKVLALVYINVLFLALGCVMETTALLLLFTPVFLPIIDALGVDRVHFGVFFVLNLMIGTLTPPVGTVMYIVLNISKVKMIDFAREVWPMLVALTAVLFLITFYPPAVLFIPNLLMGTAK